MDKDKVYILDNGWKAYISEDGSFMLHVIPIPNNIFRIEQRVKITEEIFNAIINGERQVKELFREFNLHEYIIDWKKDDRPKPILKNSKKRFYGIDYAVVEEDFGYFMEYLLSIHGGGSRKIKINKDIYLKARNSKLSTSDLFREYDLYLYDKPEFDVMPDFSLFNPKNQQNDE